MELKEAPAAFLHNLESNSMSKLGQALRLFLVSSDLVVSNKIRSMLVAPAEQLALETSLPEAEIDLRTSGADIIIGDVSVSDSWDNVVFEKFDEWAADYPMIILCPHVRDTKKYRDSARWAVDIFPVDIVNDSRFVCVVRTAMLRFHTGIDTED